MTYKTVAVINRDTDLLSRVTACVATENLSDFPEQWVSDRVWDLATQPGWAEAWESSLAAHPDDPDYRPGDDEVVITDGMILSAVQSIVATEAQHQE